MAHFSTDTAIRRRVRLRLQRKVAYVITLVIMAMMGTLFSTAAFAAGESSADILAMLFLLGATAALFLLLLWYVVQLQEA